ncbi:acyl carrier protein [Aerococcus urinaehominis]|uniref:Acyl carrier protein n=1 Tax=Aerococcus urinaehominis TaxID=128944 RepID=A0A109RGJ4_9LACT|nr:acyl carrier protein [Aerococcus urinaehominis]AMB98964.1 acyl carrier protein [Aerococcus urinaehominis]SDM37034.1 acyl carrier protein [Aerococcus urinaehominis]
MLPTNTTVEIVSQLLVERFGVDENKVGNDLVFSRDLGADSLDIIEVVMQLEDKFEIRIADDDLENIQTMGDLVRIIDHEVASK